jgi:hypothetical protein
MITPDFPAHAEKTRQTRLIHAQLLLDILFLPFPMILTEAGEATLTVER